MNTSTLGTKQRLELHDLDGDYAGVKMQSFLLFRATAPAMPPAAHAQPSDTPGEILVRCPARDPNRENPRSGLSCGILGSWISGPKAAAPLTDAGLTPYHAIKGALPNLTPDSTVVMIGIGGLGHMGVQILRAVSATRLVGSRHQ